MDTASELEADTVASNTAAAEGIAVLVVAVVAVVGDGQVAAEDGKVEESTEHWMSLLLMQEDMQHQSM
jgi:hypothetical protein